jgi:hypothetical protein
MSHLLDVAVTSRSSSFSRSVINSPYHWSRYFLPLWAVFALSVPAPAQTTQPFTVSPLSEDAAQGEPPTIPLEPPARRHPADIVPSRATTECKIKVERVSDFIATEFAPPLSSLLHGTPPATIATTVDPLIEQARTRLDEAERCISADESDADEDTVWELTDRLQMLRGFLDLFAALVRNDDTEEARERLIDACNGIAFYLDDNNSDIVESAKFWQGVAYRRAGRPKRTVQTLRPVLTAPHDFRMGLLARLEHCRALADMNRHAAGLALALKIEVRLDAWFKDNDADVRRRASESLRAVKIELLRGWADELENNGDRNTAENARREAKVLLDADPWPLPHDRRLALDRAINGISGWKTEAAVAARTP